MRVAVSSALLAVVASLLSGCAMQMKQHPISSVTEGEAVIVMGMSPRSRISLFEGQNTDAGDWSCTGFLNVANVWSEDGFVVLKLPVRSGKKNYGVAQILPTGIGGTSFRPKKGTGIPTFQAEPGTVTFVGAVQIRTRSTGIGLARDESVTLEHAKAHLAQRHPGMEHDVRLNPLTIRPATGGC